MSMARHTYGDWIRHDTSGKVAVICPGDMKNYVVNVQYADGNIEAMTIFDYSLITEWDYYSKVDPSRCGEPIRTVADSFFFSPYMQEDWFCGGMMKSQFRTKGEDLFG